MTNPFDATYLATATNQFGPFAWIFFVLQIAAALGGLYILYVRTDSNAVRRALWRQLGIGLLVVGGVGVVLGVLRLANVPVFNQRYWFYIEMLLEIIFAAYVIYYARTTYPRLIAASQPTRGNRPDSVRRANASAAPTRSASNQQTSNTTSVPSMPRPMATTARREARRSRKRRSR